MNHHSSRKTLDEFLFLRHGTYAYQGENNDQNIAFHNYHKFITKTKLAKIVVLSLT
jgi:hypothetical protein